MKKLHLINNLYAYSGITRHLLILSKVAPSNNLILAIKNDNVVENFRNFGIKVSSNKSLSNPIYAIFYLIDFIKKNNIDIVHTHHRYFDVILWFINKFYKIPNLCTVHSIVKGKKNISYKSKYLIAVSNSVKDHLVNYFGIDRSSISVVYNFIDQDLIRPKLSKCELVDKYNFSQNSFKIGFFGKLSIEEKGIDVLLRAISVMLNEFEINYQLILIGDGLEKDYVEDYCDKYGINFILLASQREIENFYQILDCYILPSNVDPFPYAMLECAALNVPFIGSNVNGISEYIDDGYNGLLFKNGDFNELKDKIIYLYNNPEKTSELVKNNYNKVTKHHNYKMINSLNKIYEEVLHEQLDILGVKVNFINYSDMLKCINLNKTVGWVNQHFLNLSTKNFEFKESLNKFDIIFPDGIGVRLAATFKYRKRIKSEKVTCPDFLTKLFSESRYNFDTYYFFGSTIAIIKKAVENIQNDFPNLNILGYNSGHEFNDDEVLENINRYKPKYLVVGLGGIKQEEWILKNKDNVSAEKILAVGGAFRVFADDRKRGPKFLQKLGLEWFVRLVTEPKYVWKRYLIGIPKFIYYVLREKFSRN